MKNLFTHPAPEALGISSKAILQFLDAAQKEKFGLHSAILLRHGQTALECYFKPYSRDQVHILHSLSKSFTSTAVGFAVQERLLSIEDTVVDYFADKLPCPPCENMRQIKIRDLLCMSSGHSAEPPIFDTNNWAYTFLTSYVDKKPGSLFVYNTAATYMVAEILQKVTGQTVFDYLKPRLFEPLGFSENIWWQKSPAGVNCGGFGFNVTARDLARFGQFLLQKGCWNGKQLLNADWISLASSRQIENNGPLDWGCGYGFQFWRCQPEGVFRGDGAFGQLCVVMPKQDAVFVTTASVMDMQKCLTAVWNILIPAMADEALPENHADAEKILSICENLTVPVEIQFQKAKISVNDLTYELSPNPMGFTTLTPHFGTEEDVLSFTTPKNTFRCTVNHEGFTDSRFPEDIKTSAIGVDYLDRAAAGGWLDDTTYRLYLFGPNDATVDIIEMTFYPDTRVVKLHFSRTGDFEPFDETMLGAVLA